jgi:hypothetical protein
VNRIVRAHISNRAPVWKRAITALARAYGGGANTLYFAAGIAAGGNVEDHGLLGSIQIMQ